MITGRLASDLVKFAKLEENHSVLDLGCETGVVGITATPYCSKIAGLDLSPALLEQTIGNLEIAEFDISLREGAAEDLPYDNETFDVVVSQFGHMFAPRPEIVTAAMARVLKPGGTFEFSTCRQRCIPVKYYR